MAVLFIVLLLVLTNYYSGAIETYSLSYSYFDEVAQSYCIARSHGYVLAVRRNCGGVAPTCNDICLKVKDEAAKFLRNQITTTSCFDAIHIYKHHPVLRANPDPAQPDDQRLGMATHGYGADGCTWRPNHCGPNFCCCKGT